MRTKMKAAISRGNPPKGVLKSVVAFKDNGGNRWEYEGELPLDAGKLMMALCSTKGKYQSFTIGRDSGIESCFSAPEGGDK